MGRIGLLLVVLLVSACANTVPRQAFNKEASARIASVVVARYDGEESYEAWMLSHPGVSFGLIGGLIAAADTQSKSNRLTAALDPKQTKLQENFGNSLSNSLSKVGYQTKVIVLPKETGVNGLAEAAKKYADVDALLSVSIVGKYIAAGPTTDYIPYVLVRAKEVDTKTGATLYEDSFTYGYTFPKSQTIQLSSDANYRFSNFDTLVADPDKTRKGLLDGLDVISAQIASDLKKN